MQTHRWINHSQPQTLQSAVLLLYLNAALSVFFGLLSGGAGAAISLITIAGVAAGYGIANEKKLGYYGAMVVAFLPLIFDALILINVFVGSVDFNFIVRVMFEVLLVALLLHPISRSYARIWFK